MVYSNISQTMTHSIEERVAKILLDIGAVEINTAKPFVYTSGITSPIYTDCRLLISNPQKRSEIIDCLVKTIEEKIGLDSVDIIAGTATAGVPHATLVADRLDLPMVYIRSTNKEHGKEKQIEGGVIKYKKVVLIEDHISTGKSSLAAIDAIRSEKGLIDNCLAIFSYKLKGVSENFDKAKVNLYQLSDIDALLEVADKQKGITNLEKNKVLEWLSKQNVVIASR